jgi:hypothetical protein
MYAEQRARNTLLGRFPNKMEENKGVFLKNRGDAGGVSGVEGRD